MRTASMPEAAARPAWNGLVMVPKLATSPAAMLPASASAAPVRSAESPCRLATAAAAPTAPYTAVGCQPFKCSASVSRAFSSAQTS